MTSRILAILVAALVAVPAANALDRKQAQALLRIAAKASGLKPRAQVRIVVERPVPYMPEFLECRNGKVWPNDRPGLGVSVEEKLLTPIAEITEGAAGVTHRRPDGSLTHW